MGRGFIHQTYSRITIEYIIPIHPVRDKLQQRPVRAKPPLSYLLATYIGEESDSVLKLRTDYVIVEQALLSPGIFWKV